MCGIVGYIGEEKAQNVLVEGLKKLEYRGYDSSGIVVVDENIKVVKKQGNLDKLTSALIHSPLSGHLGIGHTRWATHGRPSDENAHPHLSNSGRFAVVHNGIIENYQELRDQLEAKGYTFRSQTDTEVIAHLLEDLDTGDILTTVHRVLKKLHGAYALGIVSGMEKDKLVAVRVSSPLIVGIGEHGNFIASDIPAILQHTKKIYVLESGEMAVLKKDSIDLMTLEGNPIQKNVTVIEWDEEAAEKDGYEHFMLKEIFEQPTSLANTLRGRISSEKDAVILKELKLSPEEVRSIKKINIIACGTSFHAGLVGKEIIEKFARIPVEVSIASECRYRDPIVGVNEITIPVSQSGETADTMAALLEAKGKGSRIVSITNSVDSSIARESDDVLYTYAGPEIAVASTKAFTSQLMVFNLLALYLADLRGTLSQGEIRMYIADLVVIPSIIEESLKQADSLKELAKDFVNTGNLFFIGRGMDAHATLEGSLKLKEVSYIHSEAYAAGELKHGTLALIDDHIPVIAVSTQPHLNEKTISNIIEVKTRGAKTYGIGMTSNKELERNVDVFVPIPKVDPVFATLVSSIPMQLLAYYASIQKGYNPDRPKNLAKSVTVE
jgi:glucosamine--fructose-6-phosphate aminotransferase (isomerizing)